MVSIEKVVMLLEAHKQQKKKKKREPLDQLLKIKREADNT